MFKELLLMSAVCSTIWAAAVVAPSTNSIDGRIVGGEPTTIYEFPWQASMRVYNRHNCGGSIISPNKILTAAHCIQGRPLAFVDVRVGSTYQKSGGEIIRVTQMIEHDEWDPITINNDIGLLILAATLQYGPTIQPIPLAANGELISANEVALVSGWGLLSENGISPNQLHYVAVPIVDDNLCVKTIGINPNTMVCAGRFMEGGADSCQQDSGGPLVVNGVLHGVVSFGNGCARPKLPGVYARVAHFRNWIDIYV